jgi:hypothetical protein
MISSGEARHNNRRTYSADTDWAVPIVVAADRREAAASRAAGEEVVSTLPPAAVVLDSHTVLREGGAEPAAEPASLKANRNYRKNALQIEPVHDIWGKCSFDTC